MNGSKEEKELSEPDRLDLNDVTQAKSQELLQEKFTICKTIGVHVYWDKKKTKYDYDQSPAGFCILVRPKDTTILDQINCKVHLADYPEFRNITANAGAAKLCWMAIIGHLHKDLDLEHRCHYHNCINVNHLREVSRSDNQKRKACKKQKNDTKIRGKGGQFVKSSKNDSKPKLFEPAINCDHGVDNECIFNLHQTGPSDWMKLKEQQIYATLISKQLPGIQMHPFWKSLP